MKTTTLRPLMLALLTVTPCIRAMESNNNNVTLLTLLTFAPRAMESDNNAPQNNVTTALLSDSCTPSEKKLQYLKKIKADLDKWYAFSQKPQNGEIDYEGHDDHNTHKTEWVKCYTHELEYNIECDSDLVSHKVIKTVTQKPCCPTIVIESNILDKEIARKIHSLLIEFMDAHLLTLSPNHETLSAIIKRKLASNIGCKSLFTNLEPQFRDQHYSLQQIFTELSEYVNSCIATEQQKIGSLLQRATRALCKNFDPCIVDKVFIGKCTWEALEQIIEDLPQATFNLFAKETFIPLITNEKTPNYLKIIITNRCLPPHCLEMSIIIPCLRLLTVEEQFNCVMSWLDLKKEMLKTILQPQQLSQLQPYLIKLATQCDSLKDRFTCIALAYVSNFSPDYVSNFTPKEFNPNLYHQLLELFPFAWYEQQGGQRAWNDFLILILPKVVDFHISLLHLVENKPLYAKHLTQFIKKLAIEPSTLKPGYSILDALAMPRLQTITMQDLEKNFDAVHDRNVAYNLLVIKHLSEKLKNQYKDVITKFTTLFGKCNYFNQDDDNSENPKEEQQ